MSLIETDAYFPLFSTAEIPIDFSAAGLVPDSPSKLIPNFTARRPSIISLSSSQAVPANFSVQNLGPLDEPLFSLFMNGADKMDLNSGFVKGLQIPEELLLQSSVVPDFRAPQHKAEASMGMDQRQFVQMSYMPNEPMMNDFNMVPQLSNQSKHTTDDSKGKKRKFVPPVKSEPMPGLPVPESNQSLSADDERNMKRQRRLVKNREAAQLFRQRQKAYIHDLEKKVADLSATNNDYRARVELLNSENKLIKEQLMYLRNFINQAVSFSLPKSPNSEDESPMMGSMPAGLTLPPEILGAMGNMPNMLGLMGAMGSGLPLPLNFSEGCGSPQALSPQTPVSPLQQIHMESHSIKLAQAACGSAALIPPPRPLNIRNNGNNAVVPQFDPTSPQQMMVPDGADHIKVKFDAQGNMVESN